MERRRERSPAPRGDSQNAFSGAKGGFSPVSSLYFGALLIGVALAFIYFVAPSAFPSLGFKGTNELDSCKAEVANLKAKLIDLGGSAKGEEDGSGRRLEEEGSHQEESKEALLEDNSRLRKMVQELKEENKELKAQKSSGGVLQGLLGSGGSSDGVTEQAVEKAKEILKSCNKVAPATALTKKNEFSTWKGYACEATQEDMDRYLNYKPGKMCPNDWYFVQRLIYKKKCFALPRRRCIAVTPPNPTEPLALPDSLFNQDALKNENVRWDLHQCKSFECLTHREKGDCFTCFNLTLESHRWKHSYRGGIPIKDVLAFKPGSIRLGLDVGGGTGSFAAHMALHGVTVMTTAFDIETVSGQMAGLPYMETIALRGIVPLHMPHGARLPLYDGVLDLIHSVNSIKYIPPVEFEELIYEWNRVLRVGGLLWFEMFYAAVDVMPIYVAIIERLPYKRLYWKMTPKPDKGEKGEGPQVYLHCVLEKLPSPGKEILKGPEERDMQGILEYKFG